MTTAQGPMPLLEVKNLKTYFPIRTGVFRRHTDDVKAVDDVSFTIEQGSTVGLVGESGSGKSTIGKTILKLVTATAGEILFNGRSILPLSEGEFRPLRREIQMIFQDPFGSLNPRHTIHQIVGEALEIHFPMMNRAERRERIAQLLRQVDLKPEMMERYPHEFSGGQRQRIGIARALAMRPAIVIADESVSALDVSVQKQVLELLDRLQREVGLTLLFITHDLRVAAQIADRIAVMQRGRMVEFGPAVQVLLNPEHPYTAELVAAAPGRDWQHGQIEDVTP